VLSLQEISDRMEITDLMVRYSHAVDTGQWDLLGELFTPDAIIDYTAMGGPRGGVEQITAFLSTTMPLFPAYQHLLANSSITVDGDAASARTMCHNPMALPGDDGRLMFCGLWYLDRLVRVDGTWRIAERLEEKSYLWMSR
jgi:SnoaL-like protein